MFSVELFITFILIGVLFVRQITVYKTPFKLNYAPPILIISIIGASLHLIVQPDGEDFIKLFRESLVPVFVGLLLYIIVYILNQTQEHDSTKIVKESLERVVLETNELKKAILHLQERDTPTQSQGETLTTIELRKNFKDDLEALHEIQLKQQQTQDILISKFEDVLNMQDKVMNNLDTFTHKELPSLDQVVHNHLDILRVEEKDHYNKIVALLSKVEKGDSEELIAKLDTMHRNIDNLSSTFEVLSTKMVQNTSAQLHKVLDVFERQLTTLRAQSEAVSTSMAENENLLAAIRRESELVINQMVLSSKNMKEVLDKSDDIKNIYRPLSEVTQSVIKVREDYLKSKMNLKLLVESLQEVEKVQFENMSEHIEDLSNNLTQKIDESLRELHKHFNITKSEISPTLQQLTHAQIKNPYAGDSK